MRQWERGKQLPQAAREGEAARADMLSAGAVDRRCRHTIDSKTFDRRCRTLPAEGEACRQHVDSGVGVEISQCRFRKLKLDRAVTVFFW